MSVVLVGRREEKLNELGASIKERFGVDYKVIRADFADSSCTEKIFKETEGLDMGFMSLCSLLPCLWKASGYSLGEA